MPHTPNGGLIVGITLLALSALSVPAAAGEGAPGDDVEAIEEIDEPDDPFDRPVYDAWRVSLGAGGQFSRTATRAELINGADARDTTRFLRLDSSLTIGIAEQFHVGVVVGFISRRITQDAGDASSDNAVAIQPTALYFIPVTDRFALFGGVSPGMYFGSSERTIPTGDDETLVENEETETLGFVGTLEAGINYRLTAGLQLQFGVEFNGLIGRETIEPIDETLTSSTTHIGTSAGLRYTF